MYIMSCVYNLCIFTSIHFQMHSPLFTYVVWLDLWRAHPGILSPQPLLTRIYDYSPGLLHNRSAAILAPGTGRSMGRSGGRPVGRSVGRSVGGVRGSGSHPGYRNFPEQLLSNPE